jgi:NarL family two-component system response regulator LiaR
VAKRLLQQSTSKTTEHNKVDLSQREHEVLLLVAKGLNNAEIAEKLFITVKTVRSHVSNILSKLQVRDRTQAAVFAWQQGIISE